MTDTAKGSGGQKRQKPDDTSPLGVNSKMEAYINRLEGKPEPPKQVKSMANIVRSRLFKKPLNSLEMRKQRFAVVQGLNGSAMASVKEDKTKKSFN